MTTRHYLAIADRRRGEHWSGVFPDFPGVTSVAERTADLMYQAKDALASAVEDMEQHGEKLPPSIEDGMWPDRDRFNVNGPRSMLILVELEEADN